MTPTTPPSQTNATLRSIHQLPLFSFTLLPSSLLIYSLSFSSHISHSLLLFLLYGLFSLYSSLLQYLYSFFFFSCFFPILISSLITLSSYVGLYRSTLLFSSLLLYVHFARIYSGFLPIFQPLISKVALVTFAGAYTSHSPLFFHSFWIFL